MKLINIISIACLIIIISNLILFAMKKISVEIFWIVIIVIALIAYLAIPKMKK